MLTAAITNPAGQTLAGYLLSQFSWGQTADFIIRLVLACACGACILYNFSLF